MSLHTITLPNELNKPLQRGHPWVYRDQVSNAPRLASGTWVRVQCGKFQAYGLWDAGSPIAVRIFSRQGVPDARWIEQRVREAWEGRESLRREGTTAYRWLYGEGDGIPGVVVDLYNDYAVTQTYADSLDALLPWVDTDNVLQPLPEFQRLFYQVEGVDRIILTRYDLSLRISQF